MNKQKFTTTDLVLCSLFSALIAIGAFIKIPLPILPFTLQTIFVMLAGLILGGRRAVISVLVYICLGLMGLPIFTEGGGISYILKPSFGYLIGFALGAYAIGKYSHKKPNPSFYRLLTANFIGTGLIYLIGMVYLYMINDFYLGKAIGLWPLILNCFLLLVPKDIVFCFICAALAKRLYPYLNKRITTAA